MLRPNNRKYRETTLTGVKTYVGETLEAQIERMTENKEPIPQDMRMIYTERKNGVMPQYDIRTDRYELGVEAMEKMAAANKYVTTNWSSNAFDDDENSDQEEKKEEPKDSANEASEQA